MVILSHFGIANFLKEKGIVHMCVCVGRKGGGEISNCIIASFGCKALNT